MPLQHLRALPERHDPGVMNGKLMTQHDRPVIQESGAYPELNRNA
jgi:hypothetical protein